MRLSNKSFPHPVVGNGDDVPGAAFQCAFQYASDKQFYFIDATVACSSVTLNKLVDRGAARFVLHVECTNTLFREAFDFCDQNKRFEIPASKLNGTVEVNCFVRAAKPLPKYRVDGAHDDYGTTAFDVRAGDILAVAEGQTFEAESHDTLRRIGSIMVIERSKRFGEHPMEVNFGSEKIRITLSKPDFVSYQRLKGVPLLASHLTTTIVLPVLIEALHLAATDSSELEDLKWHRILKSRVGDLENETDWLKVAQLILDHPIRRAFASATHYAEQR